MSHKYLEAARELRKTIDSNAEKAGDAPVKQDRSTEALQSLHDLRCVGYAGH